MPPLESGLSATTGHALRAALDSGLSKLDLTLPESAIDRLLAYLDLLARWNRVYNLTAIRQPADMLTQHLLDSLAVVRPLHEAIGDGQARVLDVGSGGGLPGIVLAITLPQLIVSCVDAAEKKARFIQQAAFELGLVNLNAHHARVESLPGQYELITARAFASLADFVRLTEPRLVAGGRWLAMKGKLPEDEMAALPATIDVLSVQPLIVPGLAADRCLVWMRRKNDAA